MDEFFAQSKKINVKQFISHEVLGDRVIIQQRFKGML